MCVADNTRDGVILHVSASREGQEWGDETGLVKKRTYTNSGICEPTCGTFKEAYGGETSRSQTMTRRTHDKHV